MKKNHWLFGDSALFNIYSWDRLLKKSKKFCWSNGIMSNRCWCECLYWCWYWFFLVWKKINAWDPIRITDVLIIVETFSQDDDVPQIITALLNQFSDKLLVHYDGCFEDSGNSVFSDLHFCSITPSEQQF